MSFRMTISKRIVAVLAAFVMCLTVFNAISIQTIAGWIEDAQADTASTDYTYVSDIKVVRNGNSNTARNTLTNAGYTVVNQDLQQGARGDYIYMGYKTSKNKEDAITSAKIMSMNDGYRMVKYSDVLASSKENADKICDDLRTIVNEMKSNFTVAQSSDTAPYRLANKGYDLLNLFDSDGTPLYKYLTQTATDTQLRDMLMLCDGSLVNTIYSALIMGCADKSPSDNWATRAANQQTLYNSIKDLSTDEEWAAYDDKYYNDSSSLLEAAQSFASLYKAAAARKAAGETEIESVPSNVADTTNVTKAVQAAEENAEDAADASSADALVLAAYEKFNTYDYSYYTDGQKLGEFLVELGSKAAKRIKAADYRKFYMLTASMTAGQIALLKLKSFTDLALVLGEETQQGADTIATSIAQLKKKIDAAGYTNGRISIWTGVDRDLYNRQVALTSAASRHASMSGTYDALTKEDTTAETTQLIKWYAQLVLYSSMAVSILSGFGIATGATTVVSAIWGGVALSSIFSAGVLSGVCSIVSAVAAVGQLLAICVLIAMGIVYLIHKYSKKKVTLTTIPYELFDQGDTTTVAYKCATDLNGNCTDLNSGIGSQWNALYISHDEDAGSPLIANPDNLSDVFKNLTGYSGGTTPSGGYVPLTNFEESAAFNINRYAYKDNVHGIYIYYHTIESITGASTKEADDEAEAEGIYLADMKVFKTGSEEASRNKCVLEGYKLLDQNLTPGTGYACYIGYKTTTKKTQAIRDIRIAANCTSDELHYGEVSYGKAGDLVDCSIYISSKNSLAGDPIYADLQVTDDRSKANEGWEPVNLFCGGDAYDLATSNDEEGKGAWSVKRFLYFHPTTLYTSGTQYLSGYAFAEGLGTNRVTFEEFEADTGFQVLTDFNKDLLDDCLYFYDGYTWSQKEERSRILYSTTYNPKRAITNIKLCTGNPSDYAVSESVSYGGVAYAACEVFREWESISAYHRGTLPSNCYLTALESEGCDFTIDKAVYSGRSYVTASGINNEEGNYKAMAPKALMVCGPQSNVDPIKVSDVVYSQTYKKKASLKLSDTVYLERAFDISSTFHNTSATTNLTWKWENNNNRESYLDDPYSFGKYFYIYIKRTVEDEEDMEIEGRQYISSLKLYSADCDSGDTTAMMSAMAAGSSDPDALVNGGEVIRTNLLVNEGHQPRVNSESGYSVWRSNSNEGAMYLKVERTDVKAKAIKDIIVCQVTGSAPEKTMTKNGVTYTLVKCNESLEDSIVADPSGNKYAIYTTTVTNVGAPITGVQMSQSGVADGDWTAATNQNGTYVKNYWRLQFKTADTSTVPKVTAVMSAGSSGGIADDTEPIENAAKSNLADAGANKVCDLNISYWYNTSKTKAYYIGYATSRSSAAAGLTDVRVYSGGWDNSKDYVDIDGCRYYRQTDDLNSGLGGDYLYIVATTDTRAASYRGVSSSAFITEMAVTQDASYPSGSGKWYSVAYASDRNSVANLRNNATRNDGCHHDRYNYTLWVKYATASGVLGASTTSSYYASAFTNSPQLLALLGFAVGLLLVAAGLTLYRRRRKRAM